MSETADAPLHPSLDAEALLVSASLFCRDRDTIKNIGHHLNHRSFHNRMLGEIFDMIVDLAQNDKLYDSVSVYGAFARAGKGNTVMATDVLTMVSTLGASDLHVRQYAMEVSSQSYRRSYHELASSIEHAATNAPEESLFDILVEHGRAQRTMWNQHQEFCKAMGLPQRATTVDPAASEKSEQMHQGHSLVNVINLPHLENQTTQSIADLPPPSARENVL